MHGPTAVWLIEAEHTSVRSGLDECMEGRDPTALRMDPLRLREDCIHRRDTKESRTDLARGQQRDAHAATHVVVDPF